MKLLFANLFPIISESKHDMCYLHTVGGCEHSFTDAWPTVQYNIHAAEKFIFTHDAVTKFIFPYNAVTNVTFTSNAVTKVHDLGADLKEMSHNWIISQYRLQRKLLR